MCNWHGGQSESGENRLGSAQCQQERARFPRLLKDRCKGEDCIKSATRFQVRSRFLSLI